MSVTGIRRSTDRAVRRRPGLAGIALGAALLATACPGCSSGETIPEAPGQLPGDAIARARPGDVITLPAGTFPGGIRLPAGVSLRGAGYRATTIDAGTAGAGIAVEGGSGAVVSDLRIRGGLTGLLATGASGVVVRNVYATGAINGIRFVDVTKGRVENVISAGNRYGVVISGGSDDAVVNCTIADNESLGLSLASGRGHAGFNNCLSGRSMGAYVGEVPGARLDHNLYYAPFVGNSAGQTARRSLEDWKYLSGLDAHSVSLPIAFRDAGGDDYRPAGLLPWSLERGPTTDWGVVALDGIAAPKRDIDGGERVGRFDVGAYEVAPPTPPRPADGKLTVRSDAGIKSAGLFDGRGREVAYLFHNLPLPAGDHPFWFPARDAFGRAIPEGTYEVRSVEADHRWDYLGWVGDTGEAAPPGRTAPVGLAAVAFDDAGRLFAAQGWSEDATNIRCYEANTGKITWTVSGSSMVGGFAFGSDGAVYFSQPGEGGNWDLSRIEATTGRVLAAGPKGPWRVALGRFKDVWGMTELDGKLYVADTKGNKLWIGAEGGTRWDSVDIPSPASAAADRSTHVVWVISESRRVLALSPDGKVIAERDFSGLVPAALAAGHGRLAVATAAEGLVRILEVPDPKAKAVGGRSIGRGDGPFGEFLPDRFTFQQAPGAPGVLAALALGPKGELAVVDGNRLLVFDEAGRHRWGTFGVFGNNVAPSFSDPRRVYDTDGRRSLLLEVAADGSTSWRPGGYHDLPVAGRFLGDFPFGGKVYGVMRVDIPGKPSADYVVCRLEGFRADPIFAVIYDANAKHYFARKDANRDGRLDARDGGEVLKGPDGKPYPGRLDARFNLLQPDGGLLILDANPEQWGVLWHPSKDADGAPVYLMEGRERLLRPRTDVPSPYSLKPDQFLSFLWAEPDPRGGLIGNAFFLDSPDGVGIMNTSGTDVASVDRDGRVRWVHTLDHDRGVVGLATAGPVAITGVATTAEIIVMDRDGLGLGGFSPPARAHYQGYFLDHPEAVRAYRGPDGGTYALIADNFNGRHHWFRLAGAERIRTASVPVTLGRERAASLAAAPAPAPRVSTRPPRPIVRIPRLASPLPIDGDLAKWRKAVPKPQIVITPESSSGRIDGPRDCTAVVRLAYRGDDLYAQFLIFDDVVSFHQDMNRHYKQDGIEMCLNGFLSGFKFDATVTTDAGPIVHRNRFYFQNVAWAMPESHVPRVMKVLDDARDVAERDLIEGVYGLDMSKSRVTVIEMKLPIDATTYKDSPKELKEIAPLGPGREFWIGFLVNDNDEPGTDVQDYLTWPPGYTNFGPVDDGARAILE